MPTDLDELQRRAIFAALVATRGYGPDVAHARDLVATRFGVTPEQVEGVEREGLDNEWPPLGSERLAARASLVARPTPSPDTGSPTQIPGPPRPGGDPPPALAHWHTPTTPADTPLLPPSACIRLPRDARLEPPAAVAVCWYCGRLSDRVDPPGWVTAEVAGDGTVEYTFGACPDCLDEHLGRVGGPVQPPPT